MRNLIKAIASLPSLDGESLTPSQVKELGCCCKECPDCEMFCSVNGIDLVVKPIFASGNTRMTCEAWEIVGDSRIYIGKTTISKNDFPLDSACRKNFEKYREGLVARKALASLEVSEKGTIPETSDNVHNIKSDRSNPFKISEYSSPKN